jgi:hypothetical protein
LSARVNAGHADDINFCVCAWRRSFSIR